MNYQLNTSANDLIGRISVYSLETLPSEFEAKLFLREADNLKKINPSQGWMISGIVYSLLLNYKASVDSFNNALSLPSRDYAVVLLNYFRGLQILGKFDEAFQLLKNSNIDDNKEIIERACSSAVEIGRIRDAVTFQEKLKKFPNYDDSYTKYIKTVINCCNKLDIKEEELHKVCLSVLESVYLVKKSVKQFNAEIDPVIGSTLVIIFHVNAEPKTIADIEWNIVEKLAELDLPAVNSHKITPIIKSEKQTDL